jgi:hypothetical protein
MTDWEQPAAVHLNGGSRAAGPLAAADNFSSDEGWAVASGMGLVSLGFLKAAIRRSAAFICVMTIVGFAIGIGIHKEFPSPYQASTTLLLTDGPYEDGINSAQDDQTLAQTNTVAELAMHKLGVQQSASSFMKAYQITVESQRVLLLTFSATSASQAVRGANAVAAALLQFRAGMLDDEQEQVFAAQQQQVGLAQRHIASLNAQISQLSAQPGSSGPQSQLSSLRAQRTNAIGTLASLQQALNNDKSATQPATVAAIKGSKALDAAAPMPRSRFKSVLLYPLAGAHRGSSPGHRYRMVPGHRV